MNTAVLKRHQTSAVEQLNKAEVQFMKGNKCGLVDEIYFLHTIIIVHLTPIIKQAKCYCQIIMQTRFRTVPQI